MKFSTVVLISDEVNENNRKYPISIIKKMVNLFNKDDDCVVGKIGMSTINLNEISHFTKALKIVGNNLIADIEILDNEQGNVLKKMIETNRVVFRTSGVGSCRYEVIDGKEVAVVNDDYCLNVIIAVKK